MIRGLTNKKAQSTAEYAIVIALIVAVVVGMQTYVKRGLQGRFKDVADDYVTSVGSDTNWASISSTAATLDEQYEPEELSSKSTQQVLEDYEKSDMAKGGTVTRESTRKTQQAEGDYQKYDY